MKPYAGTRNERPKFVQVRLTSHEMSCVEYHTERLGYPSRSDFIRSCMSEAGAFSLMVTPQEDLDQHGSLDDNEIVELLEMMGDNAVICEAKQLAKILDRCVITLQEFADCEPNEAAIFYDYLHHGSFEALEEVMEAVVDNIRNNGGNWDWDDAGHILSTYDIPADDNLLSILDTVLSIKKRTIATREI